MSKGKINPSTNGVGNNQPARPTPGRKPKLTSDRDGNLTPGNGSYKTGGTDHSSPPNHNGPVKAPLNPN